MTQTNDRFAPPVVTAFLRTATEAQVNWYLSTGPAQCLVGSTFEGGRFENRYYPGLRGIVVGAAVGDAEKAIALAEEVRQRSLSRPQEPFDEIEAGIDDEARDLQDQFDACNLRLESIAHIGTMQDGSIADPLKEMLGDLEPGRRVAAMDDLPVLAAALTGGHCDSASDIVEQLQEYGAVGFLIEGSVPDRTFHEGGGATIHYGSRTTNIFYGSTFSAACRKALAWAEDVEAGARTAA